MGELEAAIELLRKTEADMLTANINGWLTEAVELAYLEAEADVKNLQNELEYRTNWELK
jgi:hypothetical protein